MEFLSADTRQLFGRDGGLEQQSKLQKTKMMGIF
jgi:hypothetical protein